MQHGFFDALQRLGKQDQRETADRETKDAAGQNNLAEAMP